MGVAGAIRSGMAFVELTSKDTSLSKGLDEAKDKLKDFSASVADVGKSMLGVGAAISAPMTMATKVFADFDSQMRKISTMLDDPSKHMLSFTEGIRDMSVRFAQDTGVLAQGLYSILQASVAPDQALHYLEVACQAAKAGLSDVGTSIDALTNIMGAYGIDAAKVADVSDKMFNAVKHGKISYEQLADNIGRIAPMAKAAGVSLDSLLGIVITMANQGVKPKQMMAQLSAMFAKFPDMGEDLLGTLDKFKGKNLNDIVDVGADENTAKALAALSSHLDELRQNIESSRNSAGATETALQKMAGSPSGALKRMEEQFHELKLAVGAAMAGATANFYRRAQSVLAVLTEWADHNRELISTIAKIGAAVTIGGSALLMLSGIIKGVASAVSMSNSVCGAAATAWTMLSARAAAAASTLDLLSLSYTYYRTTTIPALVCTNDVIVALGLAGTRAQLVSAQILMMTNAEAAATAKAILFGSTHASAASIMNIFSVATLSSTVNTLRLSAAAAGHAVVAKATTAAIALQAAATALFTKETWLAIAASVRATAVNLTLGTATKVMAGAYLAAGLAAKAFCALPMSVVILGIVAAVGGLILAYNYATGYVAKLSDAMDKKCQAGDKSRQDDLDAMKRLQQLAEKQSLSSDEMAEASKLSDDLTGKYGDLGIVLDQQSKSLKMAADAQLRLNDAMKKAARLDLEAKYSEQMHNVEELAKQAEAQAKSVWSGWKAAFLGDDSNADLDETQRKMDEMLKQASATRLRMSQLDRNDDNALTGATSDNTLQKRISAENDLRLVSAQKAEEAEKRMLAIEEQFARRRQTELENEIAEVKKLHEEYKKVLQTQLDFEQNKSASKRDENKIYELKRRLGNADLLEEETLQSVRNKAKDKNAQEIAKIDEEAQKTSEEIDRHRQERTVDRQLDTLMKKDPDAGIAALTALLDTSKAAARQAKQVLDETIAAAKLDGNISEPEKLGISRAQERYRESENTVDKYDSKLQQARDAMQKISVPVNGSFYAAAMASLSSDGSSIRERVAKAAEDTAKNTKEIHTTLKNKTLKFT